MTFRALSIACLGFVDCAQFPLLLRPISSCNLFEELAYGRTQRREKHRLK